MAHVVRGKVVTWDNVFDIMDEMIEECDRILAELETIEIVVPVWWKPWTWLW